MVGHKSLTTSMFIEIQVLILWQIWFCHLTTSRNFSWLSPLWPRGEREHRLHSLCLFWVAIQNFAGISEKLWRRYGVPKLSGLSTVVNSHSLHRIDIYQILIVRGGKRMIKYMHNNGKYKVTLINCLLNFPMLAHFCLLFR